MRDPRQNEEGTNASHEGGGGATTRTGMLGPVHPLLFAALPVLFLYANNARRLFVSPAELLVPLGISMGSALVIWLLLRHALRNGAKAGIIVSVFLLLFFLYGRAFGVLYQLWPGLKHGYLLGFGAAVFGLVCCAVVRSRGHLRGASIFFTSTAVVLIIMNLTPVVHGLARAAEAGRGAAGPGEDGAGHPDIYYIVLDGYARHDVLKELYRCDDSVLLDGLKQRGFRVAARSRSNYCQTYLSLASALNLTYLDSLAEAAHPENHDRLPLVRLLRDNYVMRFLRERGYHVVAFASGYSGTDFRTAEVYRSPRWTATEFQHLLLSTTPIPPVVTALTRKSDYDLHRDRVRYTFDHLADGGNGDGPAFVFAHIIAPHPPFVFRADGGSVDPPVPYHLGDGNHSFLLGALGAARFTDYYAASYREQVAFTGREALRAIDRVLARSKTPPVIIIQADHGPGSRLHWGGPLWTDLNERTAILNAYYLPDGGAGACYDSITPVNSFRLVLNHLFAAGLARLPDRSYYSSIVRPYRFYDIARCTLELAEHPEAVSAVVLIAADAAPPDLSTFIEPLLQAQFPLSQLDGIYALLVDRPPTPSDVVREYRAGVAGGAIPELGKRFSVFQGRHPASGQHLAALFLPADGHYRWNWTHELVADGTLVDPRVGVAVTAIAFRVGSDKPVDMTLYYQQFASKKFPGARLVDLRLIRVDREFTPEQAVARYRTEVTAGTLPEVGAPQGFYCGPGPDGAPVTVLLFPHATSEHALDLGNRAGPGVLPVAR